MRGKINKDAEAAVPVERLRELFLYDHETGVLRHACDKGSGICKAFAGAPAGSVNKGGYLVVSVGKYDFRAARVVFAMHTGRWPDADVDHIDRDRRNDRAANLRVATKAENMNNSGLRADNTSGIKGVSWYRANGKWHASICVDGKTRHLGYYDDIEAAALVRRIAEHCLFGGIHELRDPDAAT